MPEEENAPVTFDVADGVATVALNRPEKRNALDSATVSGLRAALDRAESEGDVRVVLLTGHGPDFCAGADLAALVEMARREDILANLDDARALGDLFVAMRRMSKPVIAGVHGRALGGGAGLAMACDLVVAAEDAVLGFPEIQLGFVAATVLPMVRRAVGEKVAFELVARGEAIAAPDAARIGLVNRVFPSDGFQRDVAEYARELARRSTSALRLVKRLFYGIDGAPFESAVSRGVEVNALARFTGDARSGFQRFLQRARQP